MRMLLTLVLLAAGLLPAQELEGRFHYRLLEAETSASRLARDVRSGGGAISLDAGDSLGQGGGVFVLSDPEGASTTWNARLDASGDILIAASTETTGRQGILLAVRASETRPVVGGTYRAARLEWVAANAPEVTTTFAALDAATAGIDIDDSGNGTLSHPKFGNVAIQVSPAGDTIIGTPSGRDGIFIAVREGSTAPSSLLWLVEFTVLRNNATSSVGSLNPGAGIARISQRTNTASGSRDYRGVNTLTMDATGAGALEATPAAATSAGGLVGASPSSILFALPAPPLGGADPFLHPHGVVDAASLAPASNPVAPGAFVSLYGSGLHDPETIQVNGQAAALIFSSPSQINARIPEALSGPEALLQVTTAAGTSSTVRTPLATSSPAIFSADYSGVGAAMITHADYSPVNAQSPALRGEVLLVWATGLGMNQPAPRILLGGVSAEVLYAGQHPDFPGLYQLNVRVPAAAPTGPAVPVTLLDPNGQSGTVTLTIN
jgi:uncharacterized protein (TIGR03437 family)